MFLGYNTNGMAHHDLFAAVELLAELGYGGVAVTIDHTALAPDKADSPRQLARLRQLLGRLQMRSVIETGARYLLDPRRKHEPTLVASDPAGRQRRIDFYRYAIDCAVELGSDCVSLWSGTAATGVARPQAMDWLVEGLGRVLDYAASRQVRIGFEPEPGMLIDSMRAWEELLERIEEVRLAGTLSMKSSPDENRPHPNPLPEGEGTSLGLTLDVGHVHCQGEGPAAEVIRRWAPRLLNVHVEDMRAAVHEHLMFGEGEIDFPPIFEALSRCGYRGGVYVELSRHSHVAPQAAQRAYESLAPFLGLGSWDLGLGNKDPRPKTQDRGRDFPIPDP